MKIESVGLITYQSPHLKTEQVIENLLDTDFELKVYALPFVSRKSREVLIQHRPDQSAALDAAVVSDKHGISYRCCDSDLDIDNSCDVYLVLGAGILSAECLEGKKVINCHPGIIPESRGLDSFKWAIYDGKRLGITLHYIDAEVDAGELIAIVPTRVYVTDTLATLARRHYDNEIRCLSRFWEYLETVNPVGEPAEVGDVKRRMPRQLEAELDEKLPLFLEEFGH